VTITALLAAVNSPLGYVAVFVSRLLFVLGVLIAVAVSTFKAAGALWQVAVAIALFVSPVCAMVSDRSITRAMGPAAAAAAAAALGAAALGAAALGAGAGAAAPQPSAAKPWKDLKFAFSDDSPLKGLNTIKPKGGTEEKYWGIIRNWGKKWAHDADLDYTEAFTRALARALAVPAAALLLARAPLPVPLLPLPRGAATCVRAAASFRITPPLEFFF